MNGFEKLGIKKEYIKALEELDIKNPTDIQSKAIPYLIKEGKNLIAQAQTGTGKTAAFGLPLLQRIKPEIKEIQAVILCPTRELGQQIAKQLFKFTKYSEKIFAEAVYGGERIELQVKRLKRTTHIIVATPGRLIELMDKKIVNLSKVSTVVFDEADEMLSMGFKDDMTSILDRTNDEKDVWLFSATMPEGVRMIVNKYLSGSPKKINSSLNDIVNKNISHQYVKCEQRNKLNILLHFLSLNSENKGIVFCRTKEAAKELASQLASKNLKIVAIHGDLKQIERDKVMRSFKSSKAKILIATDLTARGIDIKELAFVVHYQLPDKIEYYIHRSGRTARAGNRGVALTILTPREMPTLKKIEDELGIVFNQTSY